MKIAESSLSLYASHDRQLRRERFESIRVIRPAARDAAGSGDRISISGAGRQALATSATSAASPPRESDGYAAADATTDPRLGILASLIEFLTGRAVEIFSAADLHRAAHHDQSNAPPAATAENTIIVEVERHEIREESETSALQARGWIRRDDGTTFRIDMSLVLSRHEFEDVRATLRIGNAARKDPLVINFSGTPNVLLDERIAFDLKGDGASAEIPLLAPSLAYLAIDRNGNGTIDSGRELFGPQTDNGFAELATLDDDGNGWIDEADPAFARLLLWRPTGYGDGSLQGLAAAGIGALGLRHAGTPFELRGASGAGLGTVRATGVALTESGLALPLQEVDLDVA